MNKSRQIYNLGLACVLPLLLAGCREKDLSNTTVPWLDPRVETQLKEFFAVNERHAQKLAEVDKAFYADYSPKPELLTKGLAPEVWPYFEAGKNGDWEKATALYRQMAARAYHFANPEIDERLTSTVWQPINETFRAYEQVSAADSKYLLIYVQGIIDSLPPGSVFFAGTDAGRFAVTFLANPRPAGDQFFIISQNGLADGLYLAYLRSLYGERIHILTQDDSQKAFQDYLTGAQRRLETNRLKPGESVEIVDGRIQASGPMAVMGINGLLTKTLIEKNPDLQFFLDEAAPMDWTYNYLVPRGFICEISREPLADLSEDLVERDREFWTRYVSQLLGDWLTDETSVEEILDFAEKVYLNKDLTGFKGDPRFVKTARPWREVTDFTGASTVFSKSRANIAGLYAWYAQTAASPGEKGRMIKEADLAFRQALALCPYQTDTVQRYLSFLSQQQRFDEVILVARVAEKFHRRNEEFSKFLNQVAELTETQTKAK